MKSRKLYFDAPGHDFLEAIPVGNGRLGALIMGEVVREQVILNENSMWSGCREDGNRDDAALYLPKIRALLREGRNYEAQQLFEQHFTCKGLGSNYGHGADAPFGCYQIFGMLNLSYFQALTHGREGGYAVKDYARTLDFGTGIAQVSFEAGEVKFKREWIPSNKYEALYLHLTASGEKKINLSLGLDRDENFVVEKYSEDTLLMTGQLDDGRGGDEGVHYACAAKVIPINGRVLDRGMRLAVMEADEAVVIVTMRTDMAGFMGRPETDAKEETLQDLERAAAVSIEEVKEDYIDWYLKQASATALEFGNLTVNESLPTPERVKRFAKGEKDPGLVALYVDFAKHLMISSSQKGGIPANLQGIWSDEIQTPWNGDWHLNAQQEIYWLVEKAGLSDNHLPFLELTKELVEPGKVTAQKYYNARGWIAHTMTNPWGVTNPMEDAAWGSTAGSAAWQCHHLFEHYLYTRDKDYLEWAWPVMKGAAEFYADMLVEDPETGWLVTSPSSSPENHFYDEEGRVCALCEGPAYDRELVSALFDYCLQAQHVLHNDPEFAEHLGKLSEKLAPVEIAPDGRIREWGKDYQEARIFHRHLAHLWGVYPGSQISYEKTPKLARAAEKSLVFRGKTTAGWAVGYRLCVAARLRMAQEAYGYLQDTFKTSTSGNLMNLAYHCDETLLHHDLPKIGTTKYQFQLDGNQANATGVLLMLADDDVRVNAEGGMDIFISLLPALPAELSEGETKGLRMKGGISLDMKWKDAALTEAVLRGEPGQRLTAAYREKKIAVVLDEDGICRLDACAFSA